MRATRVGEFIGTGGFDYHDSLTEVSPPLPSYSHPIPSDPIQHLTPYHRIPSHPTVSHPTPPHLVPSHPIPQVFAAGPLVAELKRRGTAVFLTAVLYS